MSKLEEVLKALNKMLGKNVVQTASNLVKSVEVVLEEEQRDKGEKIPPKPSASPKQETPPVPKKPSFFENDHSHAGRYTPPKPQPVTQGKRYEPISFRKSEIPLYQQQYQNMRNIGLSYGQGAYYGAPSSGERFFKQAQYIATLQDDYKNFESYTGWYYSFMELSIRQFRSYVALRTMLLAEDYSLIVEDTVGYLFLFACELISGATFAEQPKDEVLRRLEGMAKHLGAMTFAEEFQALSKRRVLRSFIFLYALSHGLQDKALQYENAGYLQTQTKNHCDDAVIAYHNKDYDALLTALSAACPYHIVTSAVCKKEPYNKIYPKLLEAVLAALDNHFRSAKTMEERLFGRKYTKSYSAFSETEARIMGINSFTVALSPAKTYAYDAGSKRYSVISHFQVNSDWVAAVLRCIDFCFRNEIDAVKLKSSGMSSMAQEKVIAQAVHAFCEQHRLIGYDAKCREKKRQQKQRQTKEQKLYQADALQNPTKVEIDYSKLADIRKDASEVESRLLSVYEENIDAPQMVSNPTKCEEMPQIQTKPPMIQPSAPTDLQPEDEWTAFAAALDSEQSLYLKLLLSKPIAAKAYLEELQQINGIMPQLVIERINELALEYIGDTLLEGDGSDGIYEDYIEAAKAVFTIS